MVLNRDRALKDLRRKLSDGHYSLRRYFVDKFFFENIDCFSQGARVLDIGGKKINKRGEFDIDKHLPEVEFANIDASTDPDYLCDAAKIPVADGSFDGVILAEVLEHVREPETVLAECFRVLKTGGKLLITAPFMYHVHADPQDYGRYTEHYYREVLRELGFRDVRINKQGGYYCVLANILKMRLSGAPASRSFWSRVWRVAVARFIARLQKMAMAWDDAGGFNRTTIGSGHTTGYGIVCVKR